MATLLVYTQITFSILFAAEIIFQNAEFQEINQRCFDFKR